MLLQWRRGIALTGDAALKDAARVLVAAFISDAIANVTFVLGDKVGLPPILATLMAIMAGIAAGNFANRWLLPDGGLDADALMKFTNEHADTIDDFARSNGLGSDELMRILGSNYDELTDAQKRLYDAFYIKMADFGLPRPPRYSDAEIDKVLEELRGSGFKDNPLRMEYEDEVRKLADRAEELLGQGYSGEEVSRMMWQMRRDLGELYKDATPEPLRSYIYYINEGRYEDRLGMSYEALFRKYDGDFAQMIAASTHPNSDIDGLLAGFEEWLRGQ